MQIVAQGAQDKHLTVDPEITFFKSMHRRHTNFAVESIEQTFNGHVAAGGRVSTTISRNGDLVHRMWLEIDTTGATKLEPTKYGYDLIDNISVEVGGTRVDRHYGAWMKISDDLRCTNGRRAHLTRCVKGTGATQKLRIPLSFWFCRNVGQALPLIALQYHEVKVNVEFSEHAAVNDSKASLWVDYVYLDTAERQRFARAPHEYLIEQVQTTGAETLSGTADKIRLNFNHPVKELVWTASQMTDAKLQLNGHDRFTERDAAYFSMVQQYQHHTSQVPGVYVYSFALEPEELQPSGTCNFSRIDNATLHLRNTSGNGETLSDAEVYAVNYNVLRVKNGMGGLAFSN